MKQILSHPFFRILQHLAFWTCMDLVFVQVFKVGNTATKVDFIYAGLFQLTLMLAVYTHLYLLFPMFVRRRVIYPILLVILIIVCVWVNDRFFQDWSATVFPSYYFISYFSYWEISCFFVVYIGLSTLLKLSKSWFIVNELQRQLLAIEKEKVQVELKALRAQLNPHFFFNTLNGIYSMSLVNDERLPDTVLRLSQLMRYFLYDAQEDKVPLTREWDMLKDYIALQKIRSGAELHLVVNETGETEGKMIPPMLFITFMENAFKHGAKGAIGKTTISVSLTIIDNKLIFHLSNSQGKADSMDGGLGLQNVKRRLILLYPGKHQLTIDNKENVFSVFLELEL